MALSFGQNLDGRRRTAILNTKDSLTSIDEWRQQRAFVVLPALLVDRPIEMIHQLRNFIQVIFQPNGETACVSFGGEPFVVHQLIIRG